MSEQPRDIGTAARTDLVRLVDCVHRAGRVH